MHPAACCELSSDTHRRRVRCHRNVSLQAFVEELALHRQRAVAGTGLAPVVLRFNGAGDAAGHFEGSLKLGEPIASPTEAMMAMLRAKKKRGPLLLDGSPSAKSRRTTRRDPAV